MADWPVYLLLTALFVIIGGGGMLGYLILYALWGPGGLWGPRER